MAVNGYFQLEFDKGKVWFRAYTPKNGGRMFETNEVLNYLEMISFPEYDTVKLDSYIQKQEFAEPFLMLEGEIIPETEKCVVTISDKGERALVRFYPPTTGGAMLTEQDIISDLQRAGVKQGIRRKAIRHFLNDRE